MLIPVVLSGGSGTRLWPVSRSLFPKQLHDLTGGGTLLQNTVNRLAALPNLGGCVVVCNAHHQIPVLAQLGDAAVPTQSLILENVGRNTAPAVAIAALQCQRQDKDAVMVVLSADHTIEHVTQFQSAIQRAAALAEQELLVTFGIVAREPHTGFGYIQREVTALASDEHAYPVKGFVEKPDATTAASYIASGDYYWNSGMFVFRASTFLQELEQHRPDILNACRVAFDAADKTSASEEVVRLGEEFSAVPSESIDYAVMEKTTRAAVVPVDIGWSDVGSWQGLWEVSEQDSDSNSVVGDVVLKDVNHALIRGGHRLVTVAGLDNVAVVDTEDALLVTSMSHSEGIKQIVNTLKQDNRAELEVHPTSQTPWGLRQVLSTTKTDRVSRITLASQASTSVVTYPGAALTLTAVAGAVLAIVDGREHALDEYHSMVVPAGQTVQLKNVMDTQVQLLEVCCGTDLTCSDEHAAGA